MRSAALLTSICLGLVLGVGALLLARDVSRVEQALAGDDVRYRVNPAARDLWSPGLVVPFGSASKLLAVDDDLAVRRALRLVRVSQPRFGSLAEYRLVTLRAQAQTALTQLAEGGTAGRRASVLTLLGVLSIVEAGHDAARSRSHLERAVALFEEAIRLDDGHEEAKYNLELALRRLRPSAGREPGRIPRIPGRRGNRRAGVAGPGSGY